MTSEVRFSCYGNTRQLEVLIDGESAWLWGAIGEDGELLSSHPSAAVVRALVLNAFALKADAAAAEDRLKAAYSLLREITLERDELLRWNR